MDSRATLYAVTGAVCVAVLYLGLCLLLYLMQDDFIFYRVANDRTLANKWRAQRIEIPAAATAIEGWWSESVNSTSNVTVLYFGGNAEDVLHTAESSNRFTAKRILFTNYRGYGNTPGKPSEQALFEDALAVYDYAIKYPGVAADNIVVMGRSLGSGVATYVASQRPVRGLVLITPYDSLASVAQGHYAYFPVGLLLRHKFPSDRLAPKIRAPVLLIASEQDTVIPPVHAQRLAAVWAGPKQIHVLANVGHNDVDRHTEYYRLIDDYLQAELVH